MQYFLKYFFYFRKQFIKIEIKFSRMRVQKFQHAPKFEVNTFYYFNYFGIY